MQTDTFMDQGEVGEVVTRRLQLRLKALELELGVGLGEICDRWAGRGPVRGQWLPLTYRQFNRLLSHEAPRMVDCAVAAWMIGIELYQLVIPDDLADAQGQTWEQQILNLTRFPAPALLQRPAEDQTTHAAQ